DLRSAQYFESDSRVFDHNAGDRYDRAWWSDHRLELCKQACGGRYAENVDRQHARQHLFLACRGFPKPAPPSAMAHPRFDNDGTVRRLFHAFLPEAYGRADHELCDR